MRNSMHRSAERSALRSTILRCTATAQRTASTTLGEFEEQPVTGGFDDTPVMLVDPGIGDLAPQLIESGERALLIPFHQPRIARDIGGEDRGETAGGRHHRSCARFRPSD
jgi:hypothetical protein